MTQELHPMMVRRLADRYIEEYKTGGPHMAARFADRTLLTEEAKVKVREEVGKRLEGVLPK